MWCAESWSHRISVGIRPLWKIASFSLNSVDWSIASSNKSASASLKLCQAVVICDRIYTIVSVRKMVKFFWDALPTKPKCCLGVPKILEVVVLYSTAYRRRFSKMSTQCQHIAIKSAYYFFDSSHTSKLFIRCSLFCSIWDKLVVFSDSKQLTYKKDRQHMDQQKKAMLLSRKRRLISKIMYWQAEEKKAKKYILEYSQECKEIKKQLNKKG